MIIEEYATTDIILAAVLKSSNFKLNRIQIQGNKGIFYFYEVPKDLLSSFDKQELKVEPISFHSSVKQLTTAVKRQLKL